jgi:hypothetical protein
LGDPGCDANVKRTTGVARSDHRYATNLETQGGAEPGFSAAKGSTDSADNNKQ